MSNPLLPLTPVVTKPITAEFIITGDMQLFIVSIQVVSGSCDVLGDGKIGTIESETITMGAGQAVVVTGKGDAPIQFLKLTPAGGTTNLIIQK
ncbi:MAG TPA: hypothetical protein VFV08_10880 [Puia sp.]|nr:hypothetical protein [Puia sp.]